MKRILSLLLTVLLALALAGCGNTEQGESSDPLESASLASQPATAGPADNAPPETTSPEAALPEVPPPEDFVLVNGGTFQMGSPESEPWRSELSTHVEDMSQYDTIIPGYPNWWASIPMPVASFLEEYDFSGKTIIPFCSHGGGRFGQSLTAITKLAPDAMLGEGLAVSYSGGSGLSSDVAAWLEENVISTK